MSYEYEIMEKYPTFHYIKITRLIVPFYDEEAKKNYKYEVSFLNDYKLADIKYIKNPYDQKNKDLINNGAEYGYPGKVMR